MLRCLSDEMSGNGISKFSKNIEHKREISQEPLKILGQQISSAVFMQFESHFSDEQSSAVDRDRMQDLVTSSLGVTTVDKDTQFDSRSFGGAEDHKKRSSSVRGNNSSYEQSDFRSTPDIHQLRTYSMQRAPALGISHSQDFSINSSPCVRRGLDNCTTAPAEPHRNLFFESHEIVFSKSMSEKRQTPRHDLKFDRRLELEKEKLIANLVRIQNDGTVEVDITKNTPAASELLELHSFEGTSLYTDYFAADFNKSIPRLKIAVLVVGTRGDVQPFLAMARRLQEFGHHVRLATHINFCTFVKSAGVDFYPLGGDPFVLAGYMARNKGFIPSTTGEIFKQRKQLKAIIESLLPACTEPDMETGEPFNAQAIIANPPAYGNAHVAEALGVPLHIFFTMPWTPTHEFPHPLARVPQSAGYWLSYIAVDLLIWWSIRGYINDFRKKKLKLAPIAYFSMFHGSISHFPTGYMWSPHVVPKPKDWGPLVDVVGYCFLNLGSKYQPSEDFAQWIHKGTKPIYIGFGSMPLEDPKKTTDIILEALKNTGQRGIIGRGWGDLGSFPDIPENIFLLEDCPHDWMFPQCSAVVHHGGAGTTATGLRAGCPTTIVPFFGDQFFWGDKIYKRGLGPVPIPISQLSIESLSEAIKFMLQAEVKSRAMEIAKLIENEDGVAAAVDAFHRHLPSEFPLPTKSREDDDQPSSLQWFFIQIGKFCGLSCGL